MGDDQARIHERHRPQHRSSNQRVVDGDDASTRSEIGRPAAGGSATSRPLPAFVLATRRVTRATPGLVGNPTIPVRTAVYPPEMRALQRVTTVLEHRLMLRTR